MHITSHASCAPIVDIRPDGTVRISRMQYKKKGQYSVRHIMETGKNGQSVLDTLRDGVLKEGAKDRLNFKMKILTEDPILINLVADDYHFGDTQMKVAFPVSVNEDELRDFPLSDDDHPDEIHGPITLVEISKLILETERNTAPFHYRTTRAVLVWAAREKSAVFNRYERLVMRWADDHMPPLTGAEKVAIAAYPGKW